MPRIEMTCFEPKKEKDVERCNTKFDFDTSESGTVLPPKCPNCGSRNTHCTDLSVRKSLEQYKTRKGLR